jgi:hypothetical protein
LTRPRSRRSEPADGRGQPGAQQVAGAQQLCAKAPVDPHPPEQQTLEYEQPDALARRFPGRQQPAPSGQGQAARQILSHRRRPARRRNSLGKTGILLEHPAQPRRGVHEPIYVCYLVDAAVCGLSSLLAGVSRALLVEAERERFEQAVRDRGVERLLERHRMPACCARDLLESVLL